MMRNVGGTINMMPYLKEIIIDNPEDVWPNSEKTGKPLDLCTLAVGALANAGRFSGINLTVNVKLNLRSCKAYYGNTTVDEIKKFLALKISNAK